MGQQELFFQAGGVLLGLLAALVLANALGALILRLWPGILAVREKSVLEDPLSLCERLFPDKAPAWYGLKDMDELRQFHLDRRRLESFGIEYEALTEFRHKPVQSRHVNISAQGFRHVAGQGPWPPDPACCNIFFFGGSTAFGWSADAASIPSQLQELLGGRMDKPVRVYNFGRAAYFSSQEKTLFFALLATGHRPDAAVFLDGINDFTRVDGRTVTSWMFAEAIRGHYASVREADMSRLEGRVRWFRLWMFVRSLPMFTLADALAARLSPQADTVQEQTSYEPLTPGQVESVVERLLANHAQIAAQCAAAGVRPLFVIQPHPTYRYDRAHHEAVPQGRGLAGNERAGDGYPRLLEALAASEVHRGKTLDLSCIQDGRAENLYLDEAHYTAAFCREIAGHIADRLAGLEISRPGAAREAGKGEDGRSVPARSKTAESGGAQ